MLNRLKNWLALTQTERNVILFLSATLTVGVGIKLYRVTFPDQPNFDYRSSDSTFAALSQAIEDEESDEEATNGKININKATKAQLMKLSGIGEITAERILVYRGELGEFKSLDQLLNVKGISKKKLEKLKAFITVQ